jgi:DNA-binding IclR family transcriptional regulator
MDLHERLRQSEQSRRLAWQVLQGILSKEPIESFTRRTLVDPAALRSHLATVRARGVAFDDEEFSVGVRCIAAPVSLHDDSTIGAIGISGPSPRLGGDRVRQLEQIVRDEALTLSRKLGWTEAALVAS